LGALIEEEIYEVYNVVLKYKNLTRTTSGNFAASISNDAHYCPSIEGKLEYNPNDFSMQINFSQESN
jgi:hypothetical protein